MTASYTSVRAWESLPTADVTGSHVEGRAQPHVNVPPRCGEPPSVVGVLDDPAAWTHWEQLSQLSSSRVVGRKQHQMLMGGFPYEVEAVGAPQSVTESLRAVAHRGTVLLLGAAGISEVDLTPIWYKEAALVGSIDHTVDAALPGERHHPGCDILGPVIDDEVGAGQPRLHVLEL